jgi:hypothetical protein
MRDLTKIAANRQEWTNKMFYRDPVVIGATVGRRSDGINFRQT